MEEALVLTKYASDVTIIHRRDAFRASQAMQQKIFELEKQGRLKILWNTEVTEIKGGEKLEAAVILNNKTKETSKLSIDGLFVAIGHTPSTPIFQGKLELDEKGYVNKIPKGVFNMTTSVPGVFVAGDVHDYHYKQAITAAGFGCMAAMEALKYLETVKSSQKPG